MSEIARHRRRAEQRLVRQKGFTLIELMIVVAIIGILAAIAIPQYNNYVARTQVAEVLVLLIPVKQALTLYHQENGKFPDQAVRDDRHAALGIPTTREYRFSPAHVRALHVEQGSGVILVEFKDEKRVNALISRKRFSMHPSLVSGVITSWSCIPDSIRPMDEAFIKSCM
ncbi:MAG: hypothetical protein CL386_06385 [Acidiferrobacter sp.]|nr:hypothetical protein [Acidiferrobacter sp.]